MSILDFFLNFGHFSWQSNLNILGQELADIDLFLADEYLHSGDNVKLASLE